MIGEGFLIRYRVSLDKARHAGGQFGQQWILGCPSHDPQGAACGAMSHRWRRSAYVPSRNQRYLKLQRGKFNAANLRRRDYIASYAY